MIEIHRFNIRPKWELTPTTSKLTTRKNRKWSPQPFRNARDSEGHKAADEIKRIGVGNQEIDRRPKSKDCEGNARSPTYAERWRSRIGKNTTGRRQRLYSGRSGCKRKTIKREPKSGDYDAPKDDPVLRGLIAATQEAVRQRILFEQVDRILFKPAIGAEGSFDVEWEERDPTAPDWRWGKSGQRFEVVSYRDASRRPGVKMPKGGLDGIRIEKVKALIDDRDFIGAGRLLIKIKQASQGRRGAFGQSLKAAGIHPRTASRCVAAANSDSK